MYIYYNLFVALAIIYSSYTVHCQECVTFDFEYIPEFEYNSTICETIAPWNVVRKNISDDLIQVNDKPIIFPSSKMSCMTTDPFHIDTRGILEITLYVDIIGAKDFVGVVAKRMPAEAENMNVGIAFASLKHGLGSKVGFKNIILEWNVEGETDIYLVFIGAAAKESKLYITSYRYIPPNKTAKTCHDETTTETVLEYDESNVQLESTDNNNLVKDKNKMKTDRTAQIETENSNNASENSDDSSEKASSQQNNESNEIVSENDEYIKNDTEQSDESIENSVPTLLDEILNKNDITEGESETVKYIVDTNDSIDKFEKSLWKTLWTRAAILMCVIGACIICWYFIEFGKKKIKTRRDNKLGKNTNDLSKSDTKDEKAKYNP
ncbi:hypothetical protein JYU34_015954 [Plutella xylostella]|uniref:Uncharacterized protein n=1 Tax=Plutella xylostella TaxID=51655 RepID=A0ABQ7Q5C4_PLUXY|nr:hypothetical protein JYU34_015954 [Plutella xylostella]